MNRARHAGMLDCEEMKENIARQSEAANVHGDVHSPPRSLPFGLDLLGLHGKIKSESGSVHTFDTSLQIKGKEALS